MQSVRQQKDAPVKQNRVGHGRWETGDGGAGCVARGRWTGGGIEGRKGWSDGEGGYTETDEDEGERRLRGPTTDENRWTLAAGNGGIGRVH